MNELKEIGKVNLLDYKRQFNYSAINNYAVSQAKGEVLILLNNDTEVISPEWLTELISHALRRDVGAVGALLLYPDSFVQHAGVIVGLGGVAGHAHPNFPSNAPGYFGHIQTTRDVSAVTGACLAVRKDIYYEVGGLDEDNLPVAFNDIDFCLRVGEKGYKNIYTPFARLYHHESKTRGLEDTPEKQARFEGECNYMRKRHSKAIASDPFYNPNLSIVTGDYSLSFAPKLPRITDLISGLKELEKASG